jgi:type III secretion protein J
VRLTAFAVQSSPTARRRFVTALVGLALALGLTGCGSETVVHGVNEKEANQIIEALARYDITSGKVMNTSGREVTYDVTVGYAQRLDAIKVLNELDLPRRRDRGYNEIFAESGLIPTAAEEKAKRLAAVEGEIEKQLKLIDGVLDVEVQVVMPDESDLRTTREQEPTTTASVTMKYLPRADGTRPVSEPEVQAVVAAGVEKLLPENVVVLMRKVEPPAPERGAKLSGVLGRLNQRALFGIVIGLLALAAIGWFVAIFSQWQVRAVRGRLIRLQAEIAKARKKSSEALPVAVSGSSS